MNNVVQRLRAPKQKAERERFTAGVEAGKDWAKGTAKATELTRLEELHDRLMREPINDWDWFFDLAECQSAYSTAERLAFEILPGDQPDRRNAASFWECAVGKNAEGPCYDSWIRGFAEGALEVCREVQVQVED